MTPFHSVEIPSGFSGNSGTRELDIASLLNSSPTGVRAITCFVDADLAVQEEDEQNNTRVALLSRYDLELRNLSLTKTRMSLSMRMQEVQRRLFPLE